VDFLGGIARAAQVIKGQLNIWVVDRALKNLAFCLKAGDPDWFGLSHHSADSPLKGIAVDRALDSYE
jgi:hypothetical protein